MLPIHILAMDGKDQELEALLKVSVADIDSPAEITGDTPLILASQAGHSSTVLLFLKLGANPKTVDAAGLSALHVAITKLKQPDQSAKEKEFYTIIKHLLQAKGGIELLNLPSYKGGKCTLFETINNPTIKANILQNIKEILSRAINDPQREAKLLQIIEKLLSKTINDPQREAEMWKSIGEILSQTTNAMQREAKLSEILGKIPSSPHPSLPSPPSPTPRPEEVIAAESELRHRHVTMEQQKTQPSVATEEDKSPVKLTSPTVEPTHPNSNGIFSSGILYFLSRTFFNIINVSPQRYHGYHEIPAMPPVDSKTV